MLSKTGCKKPSTGIRILNEEKFNIFISRNIFKLKTMHLVIVIPVYNEGSIIRKVINALPKKIRSAGKISVLAINDGSQDNSVKEIKKTRAKLISHHANLGVGCATATGLEAARRLGANIAVTFDGDGQHDPSDLPQIIDPILKKEADIVVGTRLINSRGMPIYKKVGNLGLNLVTFLISGKWTSDSQSGFKAFSEKALKKMDLDSAGYEFCSEIFLEATRKKLKIAEVPIKVIYSSYSKRKGQSAFNGVNIMVKLIIKKLIG